MEHLPHGMATMSDEHKIRDALVRLTRWKLRDMRRRWTRPRTYRLPKEARALKSLLRETQAARLLPAQEEAPKRRRPRSKAGSTQQDKQVRMRASRQAC
jgi:hypothetical protein